MLIVGLGQKAGVGKTTAANFLVRNHGFIKIAFADPLKKACKEIFLLSDDQVYGKLKEKVDDRWGLSPREILQRFGTEAMRKNFDPDIWIKSLVFRLKNNMNYVIDDCRFPNEIEAIKQTGGKVIKIERPLIGIGTNKHKHASETAADSYSAWDATIISTGSKTDLYKKLDALIKDWF